MLSKPSKPQAGWRISARPRSNERYAGRDDDEHHQPTLRQDRGHHGGRHRRGCDRQGAAARPRRRQRRGGGRAHRGAAAYRRRLPACTGIEARIVGARLRLPPGGGAGGASQRDVDARARFRADVDAGHACAVARSGAGAGPCRVDRGQWPRRAHRPDQGHRDPGLDRQASGHVDRATSIPSARHGGADRRGGRGLASLALDAGRRQRDRHRNVALRQPHEQHRNYDQVHPLRLCGVAGARIGVARGERLHRRHRRLRRTARLCLVFPAAAFRPRDAALVRAAVSPGRSRLLAQDLPVQVHDALWHHGRVRGATAYSRSGFDPGDPDAGAGRPPATGRIPGPGSKASSACNTPWRRRCSTEP